MGRRILASKHFCKFSFNSDSMEEYIFLLTLIIFPISFIIIYVWLLWDDFKDFPKELKRAKEEVEKLREENRTLPKEIERISSENVDLKNECERLRGLLKAGPNSCYRVVLLQRIEKIKELN